MEELISISARERSIRNLKKKLIKKGSGERGFEGYDDKSSFNKLIELD